MVGRRYDAFGSYKPRVSVWKTRTGAPIEQSIWTMALQEDKDGCTNQTINMDDGVAEHEFKVELRKENK